MLVNLVYANDREDQMKFRWLSMVCGILAVLAVFAASPFARAQEEFPPPQGEPEREIQGP